MTKHEFEMIATRIKWAASQQDINLADPANGFTVWFENPRGSGEYVLHGKAASVEQAKALAGPLEVIICGVQAGKVKSTSGESGMAGWLRRLATWRVLIGPDSTRSRFIQIIDNGD